MKILGTGLSGLVGSRIQEVLQDKYSFENISRAIGVDITNKAQIRERISSSDAPVILHLAAFANVDACEKEKNLGKESQAYRVNVTATSYIVQAAKETGKQLIYISTDFVFDGNIGHTAFYNEEDVPHPINWYGETKWIGEQVVQEVLDDALIIRIAYPYKGGHHEKNDFVETFRVLLQNRKDFAAVTDHVMTPTYIDDISLAIDALIRAKKHGIYHVVGSECITPFDAVQKIKQILTSNEGSVYKTTRDEFFYDRAPRPFRLALKNDKIKTLIQMRSFTEGLKTVKQQMELL